MCYFVDYYKLEETIFEKVKKFFEELPPTFSDDYQNGFGDIVLIYCEGGYEGHVLYNSYEDIVSQQIEHNYNKISNTDKKDIQVFYERNLMNKYYDATAENYIYSDEDLINELSGRFKAWIYDNFSIEDLYEIEDDEEI
jgi:hypothetical protein